MFTQGRPVPVSYTCADEAGGSGLASCVGTTASPAMLPTGTPGTFTYTVTATDNAGNVPSLTRSYTVLTATNVNGSVGGNRAGHAEPHARRAGGVRPVHPGRGARHTSRPPRRT